MDIRALLLEFKRQNHVTNDYIATYCHTTKSTVSRWLSGETKRIQPEFLERLSKLLHIDLEEMTRISEIRLEKPIIGVVKAGYDLFANQNIEGYEEVSEYDYHKGDYFLRVVGDSMIGERIHDKDLLYVKKCDEVPNGNIAIVLIGNDEVTVKKVIKKGDLLILEAANPQVEARYYTKDEVVNLPIRIIGTPIYSKSILNTNYTK